MKSTKKPVRRKATKKTKFAGPEDRARGHRYAKIIARAWASEAFKQKLLKKPEAVFAEYNLEVPGDMTIQVVSKPPAKKQRGVLTFVLPPRPARWNEIEARPLAVSSKDDWLEDGALRVIQAGTSPKPPCSKCWNGCC